MADSYHTLLDLYGFLCTVDPLFTMPLGGGKNGTVNGGAR